MSDALSSGRAFAAQCLKPSDAAFIAGAARFNALSDPYLFLRPEFVKASALKIFGGKPVCGGFAQAETIYTGTREQVKAEVYGYLDEVGQVGVMLGADCTVPTDIDDNRLEWVRQAYEFAQTK